MSNNFMYLVGVVAVALLVLAVTFSGIPFSIYGFRTLSISNINYISNDPNIGGKAWTMTVVQDGSGEYAVGYKDAEDIKTADWQAEGDVKIEMNVNKETCEYSISQQTARKLYRLSYYEDYWAIDPFQIAWGNFVTNCYAKSNIFASAIPRGSAFNPGGLCIYATQEDAVIGSLSTVSERFESTISVTSEGKTYSLPINNKNQRSASYSDKLYAYWAGNLVSGDQCPIPSGQNIEAIYKSAKWRLVDSSKYTDWKVAYNNVVSCINVEGQTASFCVGKVNTLLDSYLAIKSFVSNGGASAQTSGTLDAGKVTINMAKQIQYPVITISIDADWIGAIAIVKPVGKPQIVSLQCQDFETGANGNIKATIKNIGNAQGSFDISASCNPPISSNVIESISLSPNEQGSRFIGITGTSEDSDTSVCTVKAYDRNNPSIFDTKTVSCTVKGIVTCNPGDKRCNYRDIEQCNTAGTKWERIEVCPTGMICNAQSFTCIDENPENCGNGVCEIGESCTNCPEDCGVCPPVPTDWIFIIVAGILGIIGVAVVIKAIRRR